MVFRTASCGALHTSARWSGMLPAPSFSRAECGELTSNLSKSLHRPSRIASRSIATPQTRLRHGGRPGYANARGASAVVRQGSFLSPQTLFQRDFLIFSCTLHHYPLRRATSGRPPRLAITRTWRTESAGAGARVRSGNSSVAASPHNSPKPKVLLPRRLAQTRPPRAKFL